jgi:hypothetical protein
MGIGLSGWLWKGEIIVNAESAKRYVLDYLAIKKDITVKQHFFRNATNLAAIAAFFLLGVWVATLGADNLANIVILVFRLLLLSMPINIALTLMLSRRKALKLKEAGKPKEYSAKLVGAFGGLGALVAVVAFRPNSPDSAAIVLAVFGSALSVFFTILASLQYYKLYLLLKYCPELADKKEADIAKIR